ncbi:uncharacterized protein L969DRAFT_84434 [Mixia osmundae IAM 14324]|uniref:6-pyruvoyltetrahydropterin synthase n=1 Tax=Mixia osmundae (strain CBS 9802 / IAM 14324 / JCM 22182 / KY 12970) TaxID=764103 RepID=G7E2W6_MIXOS|nr:uncharacterized protein L969DRAFT_84434 [Mixia osmundae IAM 14324]KEI42566.1 hypothetical protein L969DRAFT_84434 [Mixia osmundae IAM 14324]GAA97147.1 hypothetical protein E5Q_03822 [Mixia osmundae IAM 14324]
MSSPIVELSRIVQFSAAHRLYEPAWSKEQNLRHFGDCSRLHGHNYKLKVTVRGCIQADGMVINLRELKEILHEEITLVYDHKNIDEDVEQFRVRDSVKLQSSAEWLAVQMYDVLNARLDEANKKADRIDGPPKVVEVELYETENNIARFTGG